MLRTAHRLSADMRFRLTREIYELKNMENFVAIDFETANGRRSSVCAVGIVVVSLHVGSIVPETKIVMLSTPYRSRSLGYDLENHHRALADAEACAAIAMKIL